MKKFLKVAGIILIVCVLLIGVLVATMVRGLDSGSKMAIGQVDLMTLKDGVYVGKHKAGRFSNELSVTIENHKIDRIDIIKDLRFQNPVVTSEIFDAVIEEKNTNVDVVSGATVSSKAYLKAIENALMQQE